MAWTPIPGKASSVTSHAATLKISRAELRIRCAIYPRSVFSETADSDGNYWARKGAGLCDFTFTGSGPWNDESSNKPTTTGAGKASQRPGMGTSPHNGSLTAPTFVLASGVTFTMPGVYSEQTIMSDVEKGVDHSFTLESDGTLTYAS